MSFNLQSLLPTAKVLRVIRDGLMYMATISSQHIGLHMSAHDHCMPYNSNKPSLKSNFELMAEQRTLMEKFSHSFDRNTSNIIWCEAHIAAYSDFGMSSAVPIAETYNVIK